MSLFQNQEANPEPEEEKVLASGLFKESKKNQLKKKISQIIKNYTEQKKIYNLEDYSKLMQYLFPRIIFKQEP